MKINIALKSEWATKCWNITVKGQIANSSWHLQTPHNIKLVSWGALSEITWPHVRGCEIHIDKQPIRSLTLPSITDQINLIGLYQLQQPCHYYYYYYSSHDKKLCSLVSMCSLVSSWQHAARISDFRISEWSMPAIKTHR